MDEARRNMRKIKLKKGTLHYATVGRHGAARVVMRPASAGTGIIAGGTMRAIFEAAGVKDVLAKVIGTTNPINVARATVAGLLGVQNPRQVAIRRGKSVDHVLGKESADA
jgi:small subunit ribosomal protein S5